MVLSIDESDAEAVRHLLTATQRFAKRAEEARRRQEEEEAANGGQQQQQQQQQRRRDNTDRYRYHFDDFENFDADSDDERDFRDLSHYTTIDPFTGKVTELWLGIIDVYGSASLHNGANDAKHWWLSKTDWDWLSRLDKLEHLKLTGCGGLPHRQLKELRCLKHISCSECGNVAAKLDSGQDSSEEREEEEPIDLELPQVKSISLRCGFQPNPAGIESLRAMFRYIYRNLTNLERITIWRLDQQQWRGQISTTTAFQREEYRRMLVETLLEELSGGSLGDEGKTHKKVRTLELNRCGLTSVDFRKLMFEILPKNFPSLQRLSLSSNDIDELPKIQASAWESSSNGECIRRDPRDEPREPNFLRTKRLFRRLRKNLQQIHLSNNPIMELLGKSGDEHRKLPTERGIPERNDGGGDQRRDDEDRRRHEEGQRRQEQEATILLRRTRRIRELEKLRDWLRLLPKLSQLGYVACVHNLMRSVTEDFVPTMSTTTTAENRKGSSSEPVVPFFRYSNDLQQQIEHYLRVNRGGRWLIDGGFHYDDDDKNFPAARDDTRRSNRSNDLVRSLVLWPSILEWSYRTSASGCFLVRMPPSNARHRTRDAQSRRLAQERSHRLEPQSAVYAPSQLYHGAAAPLQTSHPWMSSSAPRENATALYHLLREGPVLYGV